jgi:predicted transcriptional regulator
MFMKTVKEEIKEMLEKLPDNASFEEIQYHIYVQEKIEHGINEVREGRVVSQEEAEKRMAKWLGQ